MAATPHSRLKCEKEGKVFRVVLARPEKNNAFDDVMVRELSEAFAQAASDPKIRALRLSGEGKNFCAGADLSWMRRAKEFNRAQNLEDAAKLADMVQTLYFLPKPVVCSIRGGVYGGAVGLVAACDIAVAADSATFALSEVKLGLTPAVISPILLRKMGESVLRRFMLTGEKFTASQAREFGLVHQVVCEADLEERTAEILETLAENGPEALAAAKALLTEVPAMGLRRAKDYTAKIIADLRAGEEGQEGIAAFLEKRKPRWQE